LITDETPAGQAINFRIPKSEIRASIHSQRNRIVGTFTKLRPYEEWGLFDIKIRIVDKKPLNLMNQPAALPLPYQIENEPQSSGMIDSGGAEKLKECSVCTFLNSSLLNFCEMC